MTLTWWRVTLEPLSTAHVTDLVAAATEDRSNYGLTWVPDGDAAMRGYVEEALALHARGEALPFAVRFDGLVVGSTRFADIAHWYGQPAPRSRS